MRSRRSAAATCRAPTGWASSPRRSRSRPASTAHVELDGEPRELPSDARLAVYRTAQEALTNVRRHAAADEVELTLRYEPEGTRLVVEDRGEAAAADSPRRGWATA